MVNFQGYSKDQLITNNLQDKDCVLCGEHLWKSHCVVHPGGETHPAHKSCMQVWLATRTSCPFCHSEVSPFSWKERVVTQIKLSAKDALFGSTLVAIGGLLTAKAGIVGGPVAGFATGGAILMSAPFFNSVRIGVLYGAIFGAAAGMEAVYASGLKLKDPEAMTAIGMLVTAGSFAGAAIGGYIERFFFNNAFRV